MTEQEHDGFLAVCRDAIIRARQDGNRSIVITDMTSDEARQLVAALPEDIIEGHAYPNGSALFILGEIET